MGTVTYYNEIRIFEILCRYCNSSGYSYPARYLYSYESCLRGYAIFALGSTLVKTRLLMEF